MNLLERIANRPVGKYVKAPIIRPISKKEPPVLVAQPLVLKDKGLLDSLRWQYRNQLDPQNAKWRLFNSKSPDFTPPGSILTVKYREGESLLNNKEQTFTGFLMAIRRQISTPTIMLRGMVDGVAVEQVFPVFSPTITDIICERKATVQKGRKLYWIRDNPACMGRFTAPLGQLGSWRKKSVIPERLYDVIIRGAQAVKFDRRRGVFYPKKIINKRK